jgi:predicted tellurium resistance membrane protein TerC
MAAAGLPRGQQNRVIALGIAMATVLRIAFALVTMQLLAIIGLTLAGGILLLWVAWKMYRELQKSRQHARDSASDAAPRSPRASARRSSRSSSPMSRCRSTMSRRRRHGGDHIWVLVLGLILSVALMGVASTIVARLDRYPWFAWIGLAIVTIVALRMIYEGWGEVINHIWVV